MLHFESVPPFLAIFLNIIIFAGIVQGFFLAVILTTKKNKKRKTNRLLAILLVVISVSILHTVLTSGHFTTPYRIKEPVILLIGPLLLFYVREFTGSKPSASAAPAGSRKNYLHFIPFILFFLIALPEMLAPENPFSRFLQRNSPAVSIAVWAMIVIQYGFYWWITVHLIFNHKTKVESEFSSIEGKTLSWLGIFLHVFGILLIVFAGSVIFAVHSGRYSEVDTIVAVGLSCAVFVLGYEGLFQEDIFSNNPQTEAPEYPAAAAPQPAAVNYEEDALAEKLTTYFKENKPYLDEGLTLTKLAGQLSMTRNQLSALINDKFGCNFYTFVNQYRVNEVKNLLTNPRNKEFTILSLAFEAGFSSKSAFNEIFKKFTGITPSEYQHKLGKSG